MYKTIAYLILVLVFPHLIFSQSSTLKKDAEKLVSLIKEYESTDLIPFFDKDSNKYGYIHKKTKKIIVEPYLSKALLFNPNIYINEVFGKEKYGEKVEGFIEGSKKNYNIVLNAVEYFVVELDDFLYEEDNVFATKKNDNIKGFKVSKYGEVTEANSKYFNPKHSTSPVSFNFIFKIDTLYYAVFNEVGNKNRNLKSLIDQNGNYIKKIIEYDRIFPFYYIGREEQVVLDVKKGDKVNFLINIDKNKKIIYTEILSMLNNLGYVLIKNKNKVGLLDLTTMEWIIKPNKSNDFLSLDYSSSYTLKYRNPDLLNFTQNNINDNRHISDIYILNSKNTYYDIYLNEYKPIK